MYDPSRAAAPDHGGGNSRSALWSPHCNHSFQMVTTRAIKAWGGAFCYMVAAAPQSHRLCEPLLPYYQIMDARWSDHHCHESRVLVHKLAAFLYMSCTRRGTVVVSESRPPWHSLGIPIEIPLVGYEIVAGHLKSIPQRDSPLSGPLWLESKMHGAKAWNFS